MKKQAVAAAVLAAMVSGSAFAADMTETTGTKPEREKCYGIAKAGKNDCAAKDGSSSCAGQAKKDGGPNDWVYVPEGLCDKIAGGMKG